jgi:hypothetical protein
MSVRTTEAGAFPAGEEPPERLWQRLQQNQRGAVVAHAVRKEPAPSSAGCGSVCSAGAAPDARCSCRRKGSVKGARRAV